MFDLASICQIEASVATQLYLVYHPDFELQAWHTYIAYILLTLISVTFCIFCNRLIPKLQDFGLFLIIGGGFITIVVLAAMPKQHATTAAVWKDWENGTGWSSGVAFLTGVLNGAFTIGTPDAITHMAEELPNPKVDLPRTIFIQIGLGGLSMSCPLLSNFANGYSCIPLCHCSSLRNYRLYCCCHKHRLVSSGRSILSRNWRQQGRNLWTAVHHLPLSSHLPCWHIPYCKLKLWHNKLTSVVESYMVGPRS
jgi:Amino acid permease